MKSIDAVVRWQGNNLEAIRDFIADMPAVLETDGTRAHILIYEGRSVILEIFLNDGDGLMRKDGLLGVARNIMYSNEFKRQDESVH